jgi:hypothetical protein
MNIETTTYRTDWSATITLSGVLPDSGRTVKVEVYGGPGLGHDEWGWGVNWSAIGTATPADAAAYATLLAEAVAVAERKGAEPEFDPDAVRAAAEALHEHITDRDQTIDFTFDLAIGLAGLTMDDVDGETEAVELENAAENAIWQEMGRFLVDPSRWAD